MDTSSGEWLSHLAMEDPETLMNQCQMLMMMMNTEGDHEGLSNCFDPTDDLFPFNNNNNNNNNNNSLIVMKEVKSEILDVQENTSNNDWRRPSISSSSSPPNSGSGQFISFGSSGLDCDNGDDETGLIIDLSNNNNNNGDNDRKRKNKLRSIGSGGGGGGAISLCSREHVLAERKRREKMTQKFVALSALIPGLTKMDKASILGDAAKYLKELEERVKSLEEQTAERKVESVILVKAKDDSNPNDDGNYSSLIENNINNSTNNPLLEIEARASNKNVLIRIHTQKNQGLVQKVLNEIEKLHLTTLNCNTMPFGGYAMNIIIIAQMKEESSMTMKDLVKHLRLALEQFLSVPE